jgi:hypothetical protein
MQDAAGKPVVWSYTLFNTYEQVCPHQAYRRWFRKDVPFRESPQIKLGNEVHTALEKRIGENRALPAHFAHWEPFAKPFDGCGAVAEVQLGITADGAACGFFDASVWFRGKLDVVVIHGKQARIFDWKTGNSRYESAFELETQAVLLKARHPHLETIKGHYVWLKENRLGELHHLDDTRFTFTVMRDLADAIREDKTWTKKEGPLCGWCEVRDCEHNRNPALAAAS